MRANVLVTALLLVTSQQVAAASRLPPSSSGGGSPLALAVLKPPLQAPAHADVIDSTVQQAAPATADRRKLISNAEAAPDGRYPYACALGRVGRAARTVDYQDQQCGATLIHPQVALTAAHCAADERGFLQRALAVLCNATRLGDISDGAQFRRVQQILLNDDSEEARAIRLQMAVVQLPQGAFSAGDVALLLLDSPITGVQPVAVATPKAWADLYTVETNVLDHAEIGSPGQELRTVGWGAMQDGRSPRSFPRALQEAALPLASPERCSLDSEYGRTIDAAVSLCAGFTAGVRSLPCHGDSGGPLLYTPTLDDPSTHVQVGIVSGGAGRCTGPSLPGVFSRVDAYSDWIANALQTVDTQQRLPDGAGQPPLPLPAAAPAPAKVSRPGAIDAQTDVIPPPGAPAAEP